MIKYHSLLHIKIINNFPYDKNEYIVYNNYRGTYIYTSINSNNFTLLLLKVIFIKAKNKIK